MTDDRLTKWQSAVTELTTRRASYTPERLAYYARVGAECLRFLRISGGTLDVGCGDGSMRAALHGFASPYVGIDPGIADEVYFADGMLSHGVAEDLHPHSSASGRAWEGRFDTVLMYSVLQHVLDPAKALSEAHRVLRDGGRLAMQVVVDEQNPIFMHYFSTADVLALVEAAGFTVESFKLIEGRLLCVNARKGE